MRRVVGRRPIIGPTVATHDELDQRDQSAAAAATVSASALPFTLNAETRSAIEAVQFVAAHLKNEDDYAEVHGTLHRVSFVF